MEVGNTADNQISEGFLPLEGKFGSPKRPKKV